MDEETFRRAVVASPENDALRLVYADWLEEQGDPRAELLRNDWDLPRISFVDWDWVQQGLTYYLEKFPELGDQLNEHEGNRRWREGVARLGEAVDPSWLAAIDTLGRRFRPFYFWNNTGPRSFQAGELPFLEPIGSRGAVISFQSAFQGDSAWQPGVEQDLAFLCQLKLGEGAYGAATCPVHPFLCELTSEHGPVTGARVIRALKAADFRSLHMDTLTASFIPAPEPSEELHNDEIHNDPEHQGIFPRSEETPEPDINAARETHEALRGAVVGGQLWYVLLHSRFGPAADEFDCGPWVILFAVGQSLRGDRLIGVVSHQGCHNFCD